MTLENISLSQFIVGKLRKNLTDYNSINRSSTFKNWIYPDSPMITKLMNNKNNFPRISVESIGRSTVNEIGMQSTDHLETETLKITVWTVRDLICDIETTIAEEYIFEIGTDIYELINLPISSISLVTGILLGVPGHTFIKNTDYKIKDNDEDGLFDSIEWLNGNKPDDGTIFKISYNRKASGNELIRLIAQEINKYLRNNWRDWTEKNLWNYRLISYQPINFDEEIGIYRFEIQVQFTGINIGEYI